MLRRLTALLAVSALYAAPAAAVPTPSIQLGTLPHTPGDTPWRLAVPVEGDVVAFDASDGRLALTPSPSGDGSWIVLTGEAIGPVSALLRVRDAAGDAHAISVAAEVVEAAAFEGLLLRGHRPGDRIERYVRPGAARVRAADVPGARVAQVTTDASGWAHLTVQLPLGTGECDGRLRLEGEAAPVPLHISLLESITVLGTTPLDPGFEPLRVRPLRERLSRGRYTGRVGVLGVRNGTRRLRVLDAVGDGGGIFLSTRRSHGIAGGASAGDRTHLSRIRHLGGEATGARFLVLSPEQAAIVHPIDGLIARTPSVGLARLGAARTSRLDANRVFAITGSGDGEWFLSTLRAKRRDGVYEIQSTRYTPSLQGLLGSRPFHIGDIASIRYPTGRRIRENLLVSVGDDNGTLRIVELTRDGTSLSAIHRHDVQVVDPTALPAVQMDVLPSSRAGSSGLPVRVRVVVPRQEIRVLRVDEPGSWTSLGRETIGTPAVGAGVALSPPSYLLAGPNGQGGTDLIRYVFDGQILQGRALGVAEAITPRSFAASTRRAHAWLTGRDTRGRGRVRVITNGLEPGTNLPPRVDAGTDIRTTRSRVRLEARVRDANGDPLGIRWSGQNVEFTDRFAPATMAFVRPGRTQIRVRVRENGFLGPVDDLEAIDALTVRYADVVSTGPAAVPALVTALGAPEPNPATAATTVPFTLGARSRVRVDVFDVNGRLVSTLLDETLSAGGYDARWDGTRADGRPAAGGVYFVRLVAGAQSAEQRIVLVR